MVSFLGEIKRRKVFQVAAVYAVVAWLVIQIIDVVSEPLNLPDWLDTVVIILLAVGFPIAVVLAWAFDLTPDGIKAASDDQGSSVPPHGTGQRLNHISQGLVLLAVGFLVVDQYVLEPQLSMVEDDSSIARPLMGVSRVTITAPPDGSLGGGHDPPFAISPDGRQIVFVVDPVDGPSQLYLRSLERFVAVLMPGTEDAVLPFFSPDGQWVGFWADGMLQKISVRGGAAIKICDLPIGFRGAAWGPDDIIILGGNNSGLARVSAGGGTPVAITNIDIDRGEDYHAWPDVLPGGEDVLFTIHRTEAGENSDIAVLSLETGQWKILEGTQGGMQPRYVDSGHLVYGRVGGLFAMRFDASALTSVSESAPVLNGVHTRFNAGLDLADFAVSRTGSLVYISAAPDQNEIVWIDRQGKQTSLTSEKGSYRYGPRLSPDGKRLAFSYNPGPGSSDIWIQDLRRDTRIRLTTDGSNIRPIWTPDSSRVTFASFKFGSFNLYWKPADLSAEAVPLLTREYGQTPVSWSPDGQFLAFIERNPDSGDDIWVLHRDVAEPEPVIVTPFNDRSPAFSPDGRWLAYQSDESGRYEVYVQQYPDPGPRWAISAEGGEDPVWSPNGGELFYRAGDSMMSVEVETTPVFASGVPSILFKLPFSPYYEYDVTRDGSQFVMVTGNQEASVELNLVLGWIEELNRLVPPTG